MSEGISDIIATGKRGRPGKYKPETVERLLAMHFGIVRRDPASLFGCANQTFQFGVKIFLKKCLTGIPYCNSRRY
jgi:hypothetical protein